MKILTIRFRESKPSQMRVVTPCETSRVKILTDSAKTPTILRGEDTREMPLKLKIEEITEEGELTTEEEGGAADLPNLAGSPGISEIVKDNPVSGEVILAKIITEETTGKPITATKGKSTIT